MTKPDFSDKQIEFIGELVEVLTDNILEVDYLQKDSLNIIRGMLALDFSYLNDNVKSLLALPDDEFQKFVVKEGDSE